LQDKCYTGWTQESSCIFQLHTAHNFQAALYILAYRHQLAWEAAAAAALAAVKSQELAQE